MGKSSGEKESWGCKKKFSIIYTQGQILGSSWALVRARPIFFLFGKKKEMLKKKRVRSESHLSLSRPTLTRRRQPARRPKLYRQTVTFLTRVSLLFLSFSLPALSSLSFSLSLG
jgi:hypothetical protein